VAFKAGIDSHRATMANAEIMQKLRAITDQLNADFKGIIERPSGRVFFQLGPLPLNGPLRGDRIAFFATGDFQSTGQYKYKKDSGEIAEKSVVGNVAAIFYGQAAEPDPFSEDPAIKTKKILARKQIILSSDIDLSEPNTVEYDTISLSELRAADPNNDYLSKLLERASIDPNYVTYMAEGVDDFTIQLWVYDEQADSFDWCPRDKREVSKMIVRGENRVLIGGARAVKFTFTLYDSRGIIRNGKTFTHIVYMGD